jgi:hypothetical protein
MAGEFPFLSDAHGGWRTEQELASFLGISLLGSVGVASYGIKSPPPELAVVAGLTGPHLFFSLVALIWCPLQLGGIEASGGHGGFSSLLLPT